MPDCQSEPARVGLVSEPVSRLPTAWVQEALVEGNLEPPAAVWWVPVPHPGPSGAVWHMGQRRSASWIGHLGVCDRSNTVVWPALVH